MTDKQTQTSKIMKEIERTKPKIAGKMKKFDNAKDLREYLETEAKEGEQVVLDERATEIHPRRKYYFRKSKEKQK